MNQLKGIIYDLVLQLVLAGPRKKAGKKKLLIVRVDEIGDYMLWRNFIKEITGTEEFRDHEKHFLGNKSIQSIFETFDRSFFQKTKWLEKTRFKKKMGYRFKFLKTIYKEDYDVVINPTFSRDKRYDDAIVRASKAIERIGMVANNETVHSYEKGYDKNLYTRLFEYKEKPVFEFYRNKVFTEFITLKPSAVINTSVPKNLLPSLNKTLPEKYFVVFPGSRNKSRVWPIENFIIVSNFLYNKFGYTTIVCGGPDDLIYS
ncbi:MAG TPA: glycosyltransferase family 9 protein, partial [Flavisolibacter sp.]|nr:glycosyltransferase family 9 protein [Flavisolibacter sp.]